MGIFEYYLSQQSSTSSSSSSSSEREETCFVWLVHIFTQTEDKREIYNSTAQIHDDELEEEEKKEGVETPGYLHAITVDLRGGSATGLIFDDQEEKPLKYSLANLLDVQREGQAKGKRGAVPLGIYSFFGLHPMMKNLQLPKKPKKPEENIEPIAKQKTVELAAPPKATSRFFNHFLANSVDRKLKVFKAKKSKKRKLEEGDGDNNEGNTSL